MHGFLLDHAKGLVTFLDELVGMEEETRHELKKRTRQVKAYYEKLSRLNMLEYAREGRMSVNPAFGVPMIYGHGVDDPITGCSEVASVCSECRDEGREW